jgi:hypothetical protein
VRAATSWLGSGKWKVESGKWKVESGSLRVEVVEREWEAARLLSTLNQQLSTPPRPNGPFHFPLTKKALADVSTSA